MISEILGRTFWDTVARPARGPTGSSGVRCSSTLRASGEKSPPEPSASGAMNVNDGTRRQKLQPTVRAASEADLCSIDHTPMLMHHRPRQPSTGSRTVVSRASAAVTRVQQSTDGSATILEVRSIGATLLRQFEWGFPSPSVVTFGPFGGIGANLK